MITGSSSPTVYHAEPTRPSARERHRGWTALLYHHEFIEAFVYGAPELDIHSTMAMPD